MNTRIIVPGIERICKSRSSVETGTGADRQVGSSSWDQKGEDGRLPGFALQFDGGQPLFTVNRGWGLDLIGLGLNMHAAGKRSLIT